MRFGILALLCSAAWASTITADTSCSINYSPVVCGSSISSAGANAFGSATGIDTPEIFVNLSAFIWVPYSGSASAIASLSFLGNTDGLERPGLATFSIYTDGDHGGGGGAYPQAAIAGLGSCGGYECIRSGTLVPFTLGTPFSVSASIHAGSLSQSGGAGIAQIKLKLFELDGTPVSIFDPPATEVPEPSLGALAGLCIVFFFCMKTLRLLQPASL